MRNACIATLLLSLSASALLVPEAAAQEGPAKEGAAQEGIADFTAGAQALQRGDHAAAEPLLERAAAAMPGQPDVLTLLGIARFHLERYAEADRALMRAIAGRTRYMSRALYYRGMTLAALGQRRAAEQQFARIASAYPNTPEAAQLRASRTPAPISAPSSDAPGPKAALRAPPQPPRAAEAGRWWNALAMQSVNYDTNPTRASYDFRSSQSFADDQYLFTYLALGATIPGTAIDLRASGSWTNYLHTPDLDFIVVGGDVGITLPVAKATVAPRYQLQEMWLEDGYFGEKHQVSVGMRGQGWGYDLELTPYAALKRYADQYRDLDGTDLGARGQVSRGFRELPLLRRVTLSGGVDDASARREHYGWLAGNLGAGLSFGLGWSLTLDLATDYRWRAYDAAPPGGDEARLDRRANWSATLSRPLLVWLHAQLSVDYTWNESSLTGYSYESTITGINLVAIY
jgi:tetratricopeptide (TPR) repeat protein